MYVIMGATGNIGSKLSTILLEKGETVRCIGRSAERLKPLMARGAAAAAGDVSDIEFLTSAFTGAHTLFAMIPPAYDAEDFRRYYNSIGDNITTAISASKIRHVVFLSSQGAHLPDKTGPIKGLHDVEAKLNTLENIHVMVLRPTYFMENMLAFIGMIKGMGFTGSGIKSDIRFAMIATQDIARAAADHLLRKDFSGKRVHDLLGQRDVSMDEATRIIGGEIGRPDLKFVHFSAEEEKKGLMDYGMSDDASNQMVELNKAISDGLIAVHIARTAENTTPTSIEEFAGVFAQVFEKA